MLRRAASSEMGEKRLAGLALLNIHQDNAINLDDIIAKFSNTKLR